MERNPYFTNFRYKIGVKKIGLREKPIVFEQLVTLEQPCFHFKVEFLFLNDVSAFYSSCIRFFRKDCRRGPAK